MRLRVLLFGFLMAVLVACGGSGGSGSPAPYRGISITPSTISLRPSEAIQLTAVVDGGNQAVVWSLPGVGTMSQGTFIEPGKYKAPAASGNYTIRAEVAGEPTKFAEAIAKVESGYVVNITSSGSSNVPYSGTKTFSATVTGAGSSEVSWTATHGTITVSGVYTAPSGAVGTATFTDTITATSVVDPSKKQTFIVTIAPPIELVASSGTRYALPESRQTFQAKIAGVLASSGINWTASSGTITSAGIWTGDASTLGDVTVTATLASDTSKSVSTTISVRTDLMVRFNFATAGTISLALRPDKAPKHCANLVSLVNEKFYEGIKLHRREEGFVVQWGCPFTKTLPLTDPSIGTGGPGYTINFEANDLKHLKYSLGMARSSSLDSAGSQIYICLADQPSLDGNYIVFGSVLDGQALVDAIQKGDTITTATVEPVPAP